MDEGIASERATKSVDHCTLKLDRREGGPELIIMFSDYDTTASKLSCDEILLVQSFQPIGNELTFCVLWCKLRNEQTILSKIWVIAHYSVNILKDFSSLTTLVPYKINSWETFNQGQNVQATKRTFKIVFCQRVEQGSHCTDESALSMATWIICIYLDQCRL